MQWKTCSIFPPDVMKIVFERVFPPNLNYSLSLSFFQSGAKINISDGSCPERIVTVSGSRSAIYKAFTLITKKFEEVSFFRWSFAE